MKCSKAVCTRMEEVTRTVRGTKNEERINLLQDLQNRRQGPAVIGTASTSNISGIPGPPVPPLKSLKATLPMLKPVHLDQTVSMAVILIDLPVFLLVNFQHLPQLREPDLMSNAPPRYGKSKKLENCGKSLARRFAVEHATPRV